MLRFFLLFLTFTSLFSSKIEEFRWKNGLTYSNFLELHSLPAKTLLNNLDADDKLLVQEIQSGVHCDYLKNNEGEIEQVLIPLNDELQIHIFKTKNSYQFEAIPIISETRLKAFTLKINSNPSMDIKSQTGSYNLMSIFLSSFGTSIDFTRLRKGDDLVMIYEQKYRLGKVFSMPTLKVGMLEINNKPHYIYLNEDGRYYNEKGVQIESFLLDRPVKNARISSRFSKRRFHPILRKWKAHLGIDYAARRGTPVVAAGSGTLTHVARLGGYGKLIKIRHKDGYETRYAHLKSYRRGMKRGKSVKKGQIIGYVGTTGRSTGPHLHFELRKSGRAINPAKRVQLRTKKLKNKQKKAFDILAANYNKEVNLLLEKNTSFVKQRYTERECYFNNQCEKKITDG